MRYVLTYDIEDDRQRTKLANLLLDYGDRVQKSVFEADLTRDDLEELLEKAGEYVNDDDSFLAYPLCKNCNQEAKSLGRPRDLYVENKRIV